MTTHASAAITGRPATTDLAALLAPQSIAIVGASADPGKFSGRFVPYLQRQGYQGTIYPINARRDEIAGVRCYADLAAISGPVDCVIYSIGAESIEPVLAACAAKSIRLLVVTSAGFAEQGDAAGRSRQDALTAFARRTGIRVIGPNCVGFVNVIGRVAAAAAAALEWPDIPAGHVGVVSQSGGLALGSMLYCGLERGMGFSYLISSGNEADLDIVDFGNFLVDDAETHSIAMTLEGVRDGPGFRRLLQRAQHANKPLVILKSGKSALGSAMAVSHTGALAGSPEIFAALCRGYGATLVDDVDELLSLSHMFAQLRRAGKLVDANPLPGDGCAALSVSGGHVGLMADLGTQHRVQFPAFAATTCERVAEVLKRPGAVHNPVDLSGGMVSDHGIWGRTLDVLLADPQVAVGVPILTVARNYEPAVRDFLRIADTQPKPILVTWVGGSFEGQGKALLRDGLVPSFDTASGAMRAVSALDGYLRARRRSATHATDLPRRSANATIHAAVAHGHRTLNEVEARRVLGEIGVQVAREQLVVTRDEAVAAARDIGYPVVLKGQHPDIAHKTEAGLVYLNLAGSADVSRAFDAIANRLASGCTMPVGAGVLVQQMVAPGVEMLLGMRRDPVFGPVVMFGLGGIFVEVLRDVSMRVAPVHVDDALAMIAETRCARLLSGERGVCAVDLMVIARLIVALSEFSLANEAVEEVDINPLIASAGSSGPPVAVDALMVLGSRGSALEMADATITAMAD